MEAMVTKLTGEQLVIRQVQIAAVQTVVTTTAARFASIKMTLLSVTEVTGHSFFGLDL